MANVAITDLQDGESIQVAWTGITGTASLYVSKFAGDVTAAAFTVLGTQTANVIENLDLDLGSYFAIAVDDNGPTAPKLFRVTDASHGIHYKCLVAIREFIIAASLPGWPTNSAYHKMHKRPIRSIKEFGNPPMGVHYWMLPESRQQSDSHRDTVRYPVEVVLIQGNDGDNVAVSNWTKSRELIGRAMGSCPLAGVTDVHTVEVTPGVIYADVPTSLNVDLQSLTFTCVTEQEQSFI